MFNCVRTFSCAPHVHVHVTCYASTTWTMEGELETVRSKATNVPSMTMGGHLCGTEVCRIFATAECIAFHIRNALGIVAGANFKGHNT